MLNSRDIIIQPITVEHFGLSDVIMLSMGNPDKVLETLQSYRAGGNELIGATYHDKLIGVIGFFQSAQQITIRHISVLHDFQKQGVGSLLLSEVKKSYTERKILAETDEEAVVFYQKSGFVCTAFQGKYGNTRYRCEYQFHTNIARCP